MLGAFYEKIEWWCKASFCLLPFLPMSISTLWISGQKNEVKGYIFSLIWPE